MNKLCLLQQKVGRWAIIKHGFQVYQTSHFYFKSFFSFTISITKKKVFKIGLFNFVNHQWHSLSLYSYCFAEGEKQNPTGCDSAAKVQMDYMFLVQRREFFLEIGLGDCIEIRTVRSQIRKIEMSILTASMSTNIRI